VKRQGGPTFYFNAAATGDIDGLGRLTQAFETITKTDGITVSHTSAHSYNRLSELTDSSITNIGGGNWNGSYVYAKNGDMMRRTITGLSQTNFTYSGNLMKAASGGESFSLDYDLNGNMKTLPVSDTNQLVYNWDGKLRYAQKGSNTMTVRYDPAGNRIYKNSSITGQRKYIVDIVGDLPVILMELNTSGNILKTYIYGNSQILSQHDGSFSSPRYFYLHDRLGSVRTIINQSGSVANYYTYNPFGEILESGESITNPWRFTGQYYDSEINQYYLRARNYHPHIYRFTSRDIVDGQFDNPLSLHKYLYCQNEPINRIDPWGLWTIQLTGTGWASFPGFPRFSGQGGIVIDDKGNWGWMNNIGIGGGLPTVGLGLTLGFTTANSIEDLRKWSGSIGGGYGPLSGDVMTGRGNNGQNWWGFQLTYTPPIASWSLLPFDMHAEADYCEIYTWQYIRDSIRATAEAGMFSSETLGEAYLYSIIWGYTSE
jgi:RHS repeat-associated protein